LRRENVYIYIYIFIFIFNTFDIILIINPPLKMQLREPILARNMSTFPQLTLAAEVLLAERRFVPSEWTLNNKTFYGNLGRMMGTTLGMCDLRLSRK
jgi:hypothetical protein